MQNPRRAMLVVGVFGGLLSLATGIHAQSNSFPSGKNIPASQNAQLQHAPSIRSGPIDLSKYSSDVLNCAICRERLGLPALGPSTASANKTELMPPTVSNPTPRFSPPTHHVDRPANPTKEASISAPDRSAAMADTLHIVEQMKVENSKLVEQLAVVAKEREKLQEMMRVQTESFEKKMAEIERSNQETAKMLEARTLEVTKLQNRLQALPKSQRKPKAESGNAKKKPSKNSSKDHE